MIALFHFSLLLLTSQAVNRVNASCAKKEGYPSFRVSAPAVAAPAPTLQVLEVDVELNGKRVFARNNRVVINLIADQRTDVWREAPCYSEGDGAISVFTSHIIDSHP